MEEQMVQTQEQQDVQVREEKQAQSPESGSGNNKRRNFFIIVGIAVVLAVIAILLWPDPPTVTINVASSNTKEDWLEAAIEKFNAEEHTISSGNPIIVEADHVLSGGSMEDILDGAITPTVWSPGDEYWVEQFKERQDGQDPPLLSSDSCPNTVYSPLGIAMWEPMAEALGWPDEPIGWEDMIELSRDPEGWASYGLPEWGKFQFGHAHPRYSNAGLQAMASFVYGLNGTTDPDTTDVYLLEDEMRALQQNTSKYGTDTIDLLNLMAEQGPSFLHAVATYEPQMLKVNLEQSDDLRFPLVFIFPKEGTFWSGHPYCILDKADEAQKEAAQIFLDYLLQQEIQNLAMESRLRPVDQSIALRPPLSIENGTDPTIKIDTVLPLPNPSTELGDVIIDLFQRTKRKATIALVLDTSGSMRGEPIKTATQATAEFLNRLDLNDEVTLFTFSNKVERLTEPVQIGDSGEELAGKVTNLIASGDTALNQAVCEAVDFMEELKAENDEKDESRLYGIVLLSDGADTQENPETDDMFKDCLPLEAQPDGIKVYPIAFGEEASTGVLLSIARETGGRLFETDVASINDIYLAISAEQ